MAFEEKSAENKMVARKCMDMKAYNAGVTRAYYSAFQHIKAYLISKKFDYQGFLQQRKSADREFSHGTLQAAVAVCLMADGKKPVDIYKLCVLNSLYEKRRRADYGHEGIIEAELKSSLDDLNIVLSVIK